MEKNIERRERSFDTKDGGGTRVEFVDVDEEVAMAWVFFRDGKKKKPRICIGGWPFDSIEEARAMRLAADMAIKEAEKIVEVT